MNTEDVIACHECGMNVSVPRLKPKQKASCPRCAYSLSVFRENWVNKALAFSLSALVFLFLSLPFTFISFSRAGLEQVITLLSCVEILNDYGYFPISLVVLIACIGLPFLVLLLKCRLIFGIKGNWALKNSAQVSRLYFILLPWCMAEIFIVGVLVSMVKIVAMADVGFGISFYTYIIFSILFLVSVMYFDSHSVELALENGSGEHSDLPEPTVSIQRTWALLIASIILYIPANILPIMTTRFIGNDAPATIISGVVTLWHHGSYPIAAIIFIASVFVPTVKIGIMIWLNWSVQKQSTMATRERTTWYRVTEFIGRWSMVDVFVVAILVGLVQLGNTISIYPGPAVLAFCFVVILTMCAAITFDSRLIWKEPSSV